MSYIICAIIFGTIGSIVQVSAGAEMFSGIWWAIGAPFWVLSGFFGGLLNEVFK